MAYLRDLYQPSDELVFCLGSAAIHKMRSFADSLLGIDAKPPDTETDFDFQPVHTEAQLATAVKRQCLADPGVTFLQIQHADPSRQKIVQGAARIADSSAVCVSRMELLSLDTKEGIATVGRQTTELATMHFCFSRPLA
eukprot:TRINITY_DN57045_c0_g1_i1.p1 TRINITY_DN57045_c0_g1~~TRINITY_DN57045_c0_g1_i1.p1  ORF type:complete len:156 (+),score=20.59 TRINITY_DN57045_c0_g1_i1:52-468(+)